MSELSRYEYNGFQHFDIDLKSLTGTGVAVSATDPQQLTGFGINPHMVELRDTIVDISPVPWNTELIKVELGDPYLVTAPGSIDSDGFQQIDLPVDLVLPNNLEGYPPLPNAAAGTPPMPGTLANGSLRIQKYTGIAESSSGEQSYTLESELSGIPDTAKVRITGPSAVELLAGDLSGFVLTVEHMGTARILINDNQWNINQFTRTGEKNYSVILTRDAADG